MAQMTMIQAITDALKTEMKNDENVLVFGEDVGNNGGVFRATEGLQKNSAKTVYSIRRLLNQESAAWQSVLDSKAIARYQKSNSSASFSKLWTLSADKWRACATAAAGH